MAFEVQDKGGSVFYFKREYKGYACFGGITGPFVYGSYTEDNFAEALTSFRKEHGNLDIVSVVPQKDGDDTVIGYTVVCNILTRQG